MKLPDKKTIADPEIYSQTRHKDRWYRRVAELILALGPETAPRILREFSRRERAGVLAEIILIDQLTSKQALKVIDEFGYQPAVVYPYPVGGESTTRTLLKLTFGE